MSLSSFIPWLRALEEKGGKGVVNNIDARCLGRVADQLERIDTLYGVIAHGDHEHRAWLKEAIDAHFRGMPVPAARNNDGIMK